MKVIELFDELYKSNEKIKSKRTEKLSNKRNKTSNQNEITGLSYKHELVKRMTSELSKMIDKVSRKPLDTNKEKTINLLEEKEASEKSSLIQSLDEKERSFINDFLLSE